jgi:hypothetical protein
MAVGELYIAGDNMGGYICKRITITEVWEILLSAELVTR